MSEVNDLYDTTIKVLNDHNEFLQTMLLQRDDFWRKEAERLSVEITKLRNAYSRVKGLLGLAASQARHGSDTMPDDDYQRCLDLLEESI